MVVQPRPAAAVMLLRDSNVGLETFMVRRSVKSEFMPDIYVFPGGSVTADDHAIETDIDLYKTVSSSAADPEGRTVLGSGLRTAAIRELFEEANILLAYTQSGKILSYNEYAVTRFSAYRRDVNTHNSVFSALLRMEKLCLATDNLYYCSHWITPEPLPKRFDTHFFLAVVPGEQEAIYDQFETSDGVWMRPAEALEQSLRGVFPLSFPTIHQLRELAAFDNVSAAMDAATRDYVVTYQPVIVEKDGQKYIALPEHLSPLL